MPISEDFREQLYDGGSNPILELLRVNVDGVYFYYANNTQNITSTVDGNTSTYLRSSFKLNLPDDKLEGTPSATLDFNAGDKSIVEYLRGSESRLQMDMWMVLASDPNFIEYGPSKFESVSYSISGTSITIGLTAEPQLDVTIPKHRYTPATFPFLWK